MCLACDDWRKGKMTDQEALRALGEMILFGDESKENQHLIDVYEEVQSKVDSEYDTA